MSGESWFACGVCGGEEIKECAVENVTIWTCAECGAEVCRFMDGGTVDLGRIEKSEAMDRALFVETFAHRIKGCDDGV